MTDPASKSRRRNHEHHGFETTNLSYINAEWRDLGQLKTCTCGSSCPSTCLENSSARDHDEEEGQARVLPSFFFPFFRQYQDIDLGDNLNRLKSSDTVAFFIIRDTMTWLGDVVFWYTMHTLFWDGRIQRDADAPLPIQIFAKIFNAGMDVQRSILARTGLIDNEDFAADNSINDIYEFHPDEKQAVADQEPAQEKLLLDSLDEISYVGLFNFFANPEASFRNLVLNTGVIFFQLILWMAPTFFWPGEPIPLAPQQQSRVGAAQERFGSLIENLGGSSPANIYNRLMCPQCVTQQLAIFFLGLSGKILWWWFISSVPDFNSFTVKPVLGLPKLKKKRERPRKMPVSSSSLLDPVSLARSVFADLVWGADLRLRLINQGLLADPLQDTDWMASQKSMPQQ